MGERWVGSCAERDTFRGVVKAGAEDAMYSGGEHADTSRKRVQGLFDDLGLKHVEILEGIFPEDTGQVIADERFRLCHIDVDTYESAKDGLALAAARAGGIVVYDDYGFTSAQGITKLVDEERHLTDRIVIHNLNGHAVVVKIAQSGCHGSTERPPTPALRRRTWSRSSLLASQG